MPKRDEAPRIQPGRVVREFSRSEARALADRWLDAFAASGRAPGMSQYLWHVFSYEASPALALKAAHYQYALETCAEYVVLSNERDVAFITEQRPTASTLHDWLVFPPNLAWTMAFTHEDGWLGPHFARNARHAALDAENAALLRKQRELDIARQRGWA